mmetsp:Transcript_5259/g.6841  ORF Transcript_5259/g.6841 Transcript_5259/m.6841 type:complete len:380 (+) Transcript_5259:90-1229(+)
MSTFIPPNMFVRRHVPNDHECLFTAIAYLCEGSRFNGAGQRLRKICADKIASDQDTYSDAVLGKSNAAYCEWILNPFNWGGEIEIGILAAHFDMEICVVSMEAFYILPFCMGTKGRVYLLYTGQHYDPLVGVSNEDTPVTDEIRLFTIGDNTYDEMSLECARLHSRIAAEKASQRTVKKIKCGGCDAILDDADAFQSHCGEVDHDDDFAYDCSEVEVVEQGDDPIPEGRIDLSSPDVLAFYNTASSSFSNLHSSPITINGNVFPTLEHFCLSEQFHMNNEERSNFLNTSVDSLNMLVVRLKELEDWNNEKRESSLRIGLEAKFTQHESLKQELISTDKKTLVLVDADGWAGMASAGGIPTGKNRVGVCLMELRDKLAGR